MDDSLQQKTRDVLKKVRRIEIRTQRLVNDALCGAYHSTFKGQGMDFEEVRAYSMGDDVRSIDWNVTAKTNQPHVKVFREERELTILILVDLSASGRFGSCNSSQREFAAELASVLAFSAARNQDKVGLLLFTDQIETFIPPKKGKQQILRIIREVLFFKPKGKQTSIQTALERLLQTQKRKAVVFVISDFLENGQLPQPKSPAAGPFFKTLAIAHARHDVICIALREPRLYDLPDVGWLTLEDCETGDVLEINTANTTVRNHYAQLAHQHCKAFQQGCMQSGIELLSISQQPDSTQDPLVQFIRSLKEFLAKRHQKRSKRL